ncbi:MAG: hypothetical protein GWP65_07300 [Nitrosopumilaceae archaeon]|jgi:hypothetical protein|nr:hypothetical protein [Nitrosopumilaceae archaeon]
MENEVFFNQFVTKSLHPIDGAQRFFEGYLTVQVKDKQGEITIVDELIKVLPIWMDRGAPISDTHSNRIIGKGISYAKTIYKSAEGVEYPAIKITGKIHKDYHLDNEIWDKIKSGEYKGLSFGGATKANRTPKVMKDGSVAYELKSLEHYEVAVCKDPAVPLALITDYNPLAKAITENVERRDDGKMVIKCDKFGCTVTKDSLIKIEDEDDKNTKAEVLDEWKNDDNDNGENEKKKYHQDFSNADGDKTNYQSNQNVSPEKSSNRESSPVDDDDDANIEPEKKEKSELQQNANDVRHSGKEYQTNNESAQVTEVKEEDEDDKKKSGYVTEDGNKQAGGQGSTNDDTYKNSENYINSKIKESDKDMEEDKSKDIENEEKDEKSSDDDEKVEKSDFQQTIKSNIDTLTDVIKSLAETQKDVSSTLSNIDDRLKALETPTDLPLKPQTSAAEDIGAKVTVPDTYQANSVQAGLDDDKHAEDKPESDPSGLKMQEKANFDFTTETPRPNAAIEAVNKSEGDISMILKDARSGGDLSAVARDILAGKYYTPTPDEVGTY